MGKTIEVASDRENDASSTVLPVELARGTFMLHAPRLQALKLLHALIGRAGGSIAEDRRHHVHLSEIRAIAGMNNHDRTSLTPLLAELAATVLVTDDSSRQRVQIGGLVDEASIDYAEEESGDLRVEWTFRSSFRRMAEESDHWTILDRQTIFNLGSKYSVLLYQHIASLAGLRHVHSKSFSISELRALLGVPEGKLSRFADLNRRALQPAIVEINHISRLVLTATPTKVGRSIRSVTISWREKDDFSELKRELKGSKVGRAARRNGSIEDVVDPDFKPFPETGGITYSPHWIAVKERTGCTMDNEKIASDFRRWCRTKRDPIPLSARNIKAVFESFCRSVVAGQI